MGDSLNAKNTSAEHGVCICTGVGLRIMLARLTGRVEHAPDCIASRPIQSAPTSPKGIPAEGIGRAKGRAEDGHDCRKSVGFSRERGNHCKVCDRFILNAELG